MIDFKALVQLIRVPNGRGLRQQSAEKRCGPWFDTLTMRFKPLKSLHLILSLSKDEAGISAFFSILLVLFQARAEALDAAAGFFEHFASTSHRRCGSTGQAEGRAVHDRDALGFEKRGTKSSSFCDASCRSARLADQPAQDG